MKIYFHGNKIFIIIFIFIFFIEVSTQRGGGTTKSYKIRSKISSKNRIKQSHPLICLQVLVQGCYTVVYCYLTYQQISTSTKKKNLLKQFEQKNKLIPSTLNQLQKNTILDYLKEGSKFKMFVEVKDDNQSFVCHLSKIQFTKINENIYKIAFFGDDIWGQSKFQGLLMFVNDKFETIMLKNYKDLKKSQQTGDWSILYYRGSGNSKLIKGQWSFLGFQNKSKYSGIWTMKNLGQIL